MKTIKTLWFILLLVSFTFTSCGAFKKECKSSKYRRQHWGVNDIKKLPDMNTIRNC